MSELAELNTGLQDVSMGKQVQVLLTRGYIKIKRDQVSRALRERKVRCEGVRYQRACLIVSSCPQTMSHMRLFVNVIVGVLLGILFWQSGDEGSRVLDNWNLLFTILVHHMMTTMMLTVLTCKSET